MNIHLTLTPILQKAASIFFSIGMLTGLAAVTFGLISCGGGGGGGGGSSSSTASGAMTVSSFNPPGIVASSVYQTIVISGSNFASGVSLSIIGSSGTPVVSSVAVTNSNTLTAVIQIASAPSARYVTLSVQPPSSAVAVTQVLGVASVRKTYADHIYPLMQTNSTGQNCRGCHNGTANGGLHLNSADSANNLINEYSPNCTSRLRVKRGDPRRTSSFLIDKIQATGGSPACYGTPMPNGVPLNASEILDFIEWVAGGAY